MKFGISNESPLSSRPERVSAENRDPGPQGERVLFGSWVPDCRCAASGMTTTEVASC
jgi:hypothetical protein